MPTARRPRRRSSTEVGSGSADNLAFASLAQLRRLLRRRELSALELARETIARLRDAGGRYRAVAELTTERAEREARKADVAIRKGAAGPLLGIPYGAKDLLDTAGIPTRWGARPYADRVPERDATVVQRMRAAGAVLVAKLAMIELAGGGGYGDAGASIDGPCANPWNVQHWSGGSSSGSAAAVCAGVLAISLGSETGGSLVIPASFCGISTIRPSFGAVSRAGAMPLGWSLDKIGPLARSAEDCATVLSAIAGPDPLDWTTEAWTVRGSRRTDFRLGVLPTDASTAPATEAVFEAALAALRRIGLRVRPIALPEGEYTRTYETISAGEILLAHQALIEGPDIDRLLDPVQREGLRRYAEVSMIDYARAVQTRGRLVRALRGLFSEVDAIVAPTVLTEAPRLDADLMAYRRTRRGGNAHAGALAGLPEVSVPMGFGPSGLPLGLSVIGDRFRDPIVLRIAALYQRETDWHLRRPPLELDSPQPRRIQAATISPDRPASPQVG